MRQSKLYFHYSIALIALCPLLHFGAAAQGAPALSVADVVVTHSFGEVSRLSYSPDGRRVAYMIRDDQRSRAAVNENEIRSGVPARAQAGDVWIASSETGEASNLTQGTGSSWDPVWSPDGRYLAFLSDRDGSGQARPWLWDSARNQLKEIAAVNVRGINFQGIQWTPDSRKILVTAVPADVSVSSAPPLAKDHRSPSAMVEGSTVKLYAADIPSLGAHSKAADSMFNLDSAYLRDLLLVDVDTSKAQRLVTARRIGWYLISPNGRYVAYAAPKRFASPASFQRICDLVAVNLATNHASILGTDLMLDDVFSWSPDSSAVAYGAHDSEDPLSKTYGYYVVALRGDAPRRLCKLPPHVFKGGFRWLPMWDPEGGCLFFLADGGLWSTSLSESKTREIVHIGNHTITYRLSQGTGLLWTNKAGASRATILIARDEVTGQDGFYKVDLSTGATTVLLERSECYTCKLGLDIGPFDVGISADGDHIAFCAENAQRAPDLWVTDSGFRHPKQLTHINSQFAGYAMGASRLIDWLGDDGERLRGALLLPPDFRPGKRYPLLVWVYPDTPLSQNVDRFGLGEFPGPLNLQLFATRGYVVLMPDAQDQLGDRPSGLIKSILPGVNKLIDLGYADPDRIGVIGHSQGGYATLALITQTQRFKAAVEVAGWGNYAALYGFMNPDGTGFQYGQTERQLGGAPWELPATYVQNSPIFFLDHVRTPLLIVHGSEDDTVPCFLADELFVGLRRLGKPVEYAKYEGGSHSPRDWTRANQIDLANRVLDWLKQHLYGN